GSGAAERVTTLSQGSGKATLAPEDILRSQEWGSFVGRESELLQAFQVLHFPGAKSSLGVTGLAGSGKTAFVHEVQRRYGYLFPDGVSYLRLGDEPKPDGILSTAFTHLIPDVPSDFEDYDEGALLTRLSKG